MTYREKYNQFNGTPSVCIELSSEQRIYLRKLCRYYMKDTSDFHKIGFSTVIWQSEKNGNIYQTDFGLVSKILQQGFYTKYDRDLLNTTTEYYKQYVQKFNTKTD